MRGDRNIASFIEGSEYRAYTILGCHEAQGGFLFRVWAPKADKAYVTGSFNDWGDDCPMAKIDPKGLWEGFVSKDRISHGDLYKYKLVGGCTKAVYKADPFASYAGSFPETASRVYSTAGYRWRDRAYMEDRKKNFSKGGARSRPVNIYELHIPSWKKRADGSSHSYLTLAEDLAPYMMQMGYTHVEIMDPFGAENDGKSAFYALSPNHGSPKEFMEFVDMMHRAGIGVILDWDVSRFSMAEHGLSLFDTGPVMDKVGDESGKFDYSVREVQSFIISNAVYLADVYHIDGLRMESLPAVIYGTGGFPDRNAVSLVRRINGVMSDYFPDVMMITDDLSGRGAVTSDTSEGLGFTFKWDSVCTRDTLAYAAMDLSQRASHTSELSAPLKHAFGEASVLTLSHYDVMEGRQSFISKMPGSYEEKFAGNRVFLTYMMTRPGKKMRFMGSEIGQFDEWDKNGEVQWFLTDYTSHARLQLYLAELGRLYLENPPLWEQDCSPKGFSLDVAQGGIFVYRRFDLFGNEMAIALNFTPYRICKYSIDVSKGGYWKELISSDSVRFGGSGVENGTLEALPHRSTKTPYSLTVDLPPLGAVVLKHI